MTAFFGIRKNLSSLENNATQGPIVKLHSTYPSKLSMHIHISLVTHSFEKNNPNYLHGPINN